MIREVSVSKTFTLTCPADLPAAPANVKTKSFPDKFF